MDKLLIAAGAGLIWFSIKDEQGKAISNVQRMFEIPGFIGTLVIMAILFSFVQYVKKEAWVATSLAVIIALGYWNKFDPKTNTLKVGV